MPTDWVTGICVVGNAVLAMLFLVAVLYNRRNYRDAKLWMAECHQAEAARDEAEEKGTQLRDALDRLQEATLEQLSHKIGLQAEGEYLQSLLATNNNDRNMALEMHAEVRRWRNEFWNNTVYMLIHTLFREKDGGRDELGIALREEWDRETEELIARCKKITDWPKIRIRSNPVEEKPCEPSSSPEDSDSSEAI